MRLELEIQTKPVAQARPRFFVRHRGVGRFVGAYDPRSCRRFKEAVAWHARIKAREAGLAEPTMDPIAISISFYLGGGQMKNGKEVHHTKKPDIDNLTKAVTDALTGIIYADDSQIVEAHLKKQYGGPKITISVQTKKEDAV